MNGGIHYGLPMPEYLADPCPEPSLSSGVAHTMLSESPLHAWLRHPRLNPDCRQNWSKGSDTGSAAHALLLEGETVFRVISPEDHPSQKGAIPKGWTNDSIRKARDEARAEGKIPMLPWDVAGVRRMADAATKFLAGSAHPGLLRGGQPEATLITDANGIWTRCRPDYLSESYLVHYKTVEGRLVPAKWMRSQLTAMGYDLAYVLYRDAAKDCGIHPENVFFVQEQIPPYACCLVGLGPSKLDVAEHKARRVRRLWKQCLEEDDWPGYASDVHHAEATTWELMDMEMEEEK